MIKEEVSKELHNLGELRRMTIRILKKRDLKVFITIAGRRATYPRIVSLGKVRRKQCGNLQKEDGG